MLIAEVRLLIRWRKSGDWDRSDCCDRSDSGYGSSCFTWAATGAAGKLCLCSFPQLPVDDGRMMIFYKDKFFFAVVGSFAVGEVVRRDGLFLAEVADIFFVSQNFYNDAGRPAYLGVKPSSSSSAAIRRALFPSSVYLWKIRRTMGDSASLIKICPFCTV